MKTLDEIAIKNGTDKATKHAVKGHGYTPYYEAMFEPLRDDPLKLLEIGVGGGESIRTWLEYFKNAHIYGIDIVQDTNIFNMPGKPFDRYTFSHGDQTDRTMWKCFVANCGKDWDIVIDDGSHMADAVIISFEEMWPHVRSGGIFIIEDLGVASSPGTVFVPKGWPNHLDWIRKKMVEINNDSDIQCLHYRKEMAVFMKR